VFFACTFPSSLYFCAVHARTKMDLILFAARTLRGIFADRGRKRPEYRI